MPWSIRKDDRCPASKPFGVIKDADKELEGCHTTKENAMSQVAALNASEDKEQEKKGYMGDAVMYAPSMATSFEELEAEQEAAEQAQGVRETANQFQMLVSNIMMDVEIEDKGAAVQSLAVEFSERVDDAVKETPKKDGPIAKVVRGIKDAVIGAIDAKLEQRETSPMLFWKEAGGQYRWMARYTNNLRDRDNPPEIITAEAHRRFVEMVDEKEVSPPELWLWHAGESTKWGQAEWVAYDDKGDVGFMIAGGLVDKGFEPLAEAIMELPPDKVRVSHGMPIASIKRDENDPSLIVEYVTREISPLPTDWAANEYTGFSVLKGKQPMGIPDEKRQTLVNEWGLSDEVLALVEQDNEELAEEAKEQGLESKEGDAPEPEVEEKAEQTEPEIETEESPVEDAPLTREEVAEAMTPIVTAIGSLVEKLDAMTKELEALKQTDAEKIAEKAALTPAASLMDLMGFRAVGSEEAKQDGRYSLFLGGRPPLPPFSFFAA